MEALKVGQRIDRDDGRYYIPIIRIADEMIVARVSSDGFSSEHNAVMFAMGLVGAFNEFSL